MPDSPLRVLLMIDEASVGGGQRHVLWLAEGLNKKRFVAAVACEPRGFLVDELAKRRIPHFPIRMTNIPSPRALLACRDTFRKFRPDIVHTHGGTAGVTGRIAAKFWTKAICVHTYHGHHYLHIPNLLKRRIFALSEAALLRYTDRLICVARPDVDTGAKAGIVDPSMTIVIYNGIDLTAFRGRRSRRRKGEKVIGTVGRLHPQKGHRVLIAAAAELLRSVPKVKFLIIGEGELRGELEAYATELGIADHIIFMGARTDVVPLLGTMDIFVLPSLWEGHPLVLMEAMAAGLPIVASAVDGVTEIVRDGKDALLVPPGDPLRLAGAIQRLLTSASLRQRLGSKGREVARERFSVKRMVKETEDLYMSLRR
ncbi:MAG: glycosyltransferase family 4 protein [Bacteroidota bacterium]